MCHGFRNTFLLYQKYFLSANLAKAQVYPKRTYQRVDILIFKFSKHNSLNRCLNILTIIKPRPPPGKQRDLSVEEGMDR